MRQDLVCAIIGGVLFFLGIAGLGVPGSHAQETNVEQERARLEQIQQQLREKQTTYENIKGQEHNLVDELHKIDQQLKTSQQQLEQYRQKLAKNEKAIETELTEKLPYLISRGGYIPHLDHVVPPDVSLKNFIYYMKLKKRIIEGKIGA